MAGPLRLFIDTQNRKLVESNVSKADANFPTLVQGETPKVQLYFLEPIQANSLATPFSYVGLSGATIKLGIMNGSPTGGSDTAIAYQDSWTAISGGFEARLACNTVGISNAIGNSQTATCTAEIEVTDSDGYPVKYVQGAITIKAAVIDSSTTVPTPLPIYYTKTEIEALFLKKINEAGVFVRFVSPDGTKGRDTGVNNDGSARDDIIDL